MVLGKKGPMMDKRKARKVHGAVFRKTIEGIRTELFKKNAVVASESNNGNPETIEDGFKVYVRKRPLLPHELSNGEYDVLTIVKPSGIVVHECKMYPDMKRQYVMSCRRDFSKCFDQFSSTKEVYEETIGNFAQHVVEGGKAVCMMYGATGSGKTFTSSGMEEMIANDLFAVLPKSCHVNISCVEVAGSKCIDLHGKKNKVSICDDGNGGISLLGVSEKTVGSPLEMIHAIQTANKARATQATKVNAVSSRSHSICRLSIVRSDSSSNEVIGQFSLLDLAGTERSADSMHHTAERRRECIEINTSHMALKHCVRALTGQNDLNGVTYVPYRGSLLTRILKDCLWAPHSKACVIATVSPIPTDTEHTQSTLKYAALMLSDDAEAESIKTEGVHLEKKLDIEPIKNWKPEKVMQFLSKVNKGNYEKYLSNFKPNMDGKQLLKLGIPRLTQLCQGDADAAHQIVRSLSKIKSKHDALDKERRQTNRMIRSNNA